MTSWISVSERLPDRPVPHHISKVVLVVVRYDDGHRVVATDRYGAEWLMYCGDRHVRGGRVTHWMPFPELPEVSP